MDKHDIPDALPEENVHYLTEEELKAASLITQACLAEEGLPDEPDSRQLTDGELSMVSGGDLHVPSPTYSTGMEILVDGMLYNNSYAELELGHVKGYFKIQKILTARPAPFLLLTNYGWIKFSSVKEY